MINLIAMLMILAVFSIFFGFITKDMFIGLGSGFFSDNALFIHPSHEIMLDTEFGVPTLFKLLPLLFTISLSVIAIVLSEYLSTFLVYFKLSRLGYNIFSFFNQRFLIELFYNRFITGVVLKLGGQTTKVLDKGSVEYIGPYGLEKGLLNISNNIAKLNTGVITTYALYILVGVIFYMLFSLYLNNLIIVLSILVSFSLLFKGSTIMNVVQQSKISLNIKILLFCVLAHIRFFSGAFRSNFTTDLDYMPVIFLISVVVIMSTVFFRSVVYRTSFSLGLFQCLFIVAQFLFLITLLILRYYELDLPYIAVCSL